MPEILEEFNETTDLYLEILLEAQKMEDKKLIELIKQRLEFIEPSPPPTTGKCKIIAFPRRFVPSC